MGAVRLTWLVLVLFAAACGGSDADSPAGPTASVAPTADPAAPVVNYGPSGAASIPTLQLAAGQGLAESPEPTVGPPPQFPDGWTLNLGDRDNNADPAASHAHPHSHSHSETEDWEPDAIWLDIAPGATDEGESSPEAFQQPPASLDSAWTEVSSGEYRVLRPATLEELGGYRVISPPTEALSWMTRCVNHHAGPLTSSSWPQDVRVAQAVLGCTASAGLMEQVIQRYGAGRVCVQQAYSDDYSAVNSTGNSWTQCPSIGNPTPLDGRPFGAKCRDAVIRGLEIKGHPPDEKIARDTCEMFELELAAHLAIPGATQLCAEHWVLNAVLNAEAPGTVPGLQQHVGVNANGTC